MNLKELLVYILILIFPLVVVVWGIYISEETTNRPREDSVIIQENSNHSRILKSEGYENIELTGFPLWGCSGDDSAINSSTFRATKNGEKVDGTICCGLLLKGCTVRRN